jgi:hypothetical protein
MDRGVVERETQVTSQLHRLDNLILEINQTTDHLHEKLVTVITPPTPSSVTSEKKPETNLVPLADVLRGYNERLSTTASQLAYLLNSIEL